MLSRTLAGDNRRIPGYSLITASESNLDDTTCRCGVGSRFREQLSVGLGKGENIRDIRT